MSGNMQSSIYAGGKRNSLFFVFISGLMLLLALMGFGDSFFLMPLCDSPPLLAGVVFHGIVMTTWVTGFLIQAILIHSRRFTLHRQLGWFLVCVGVILIIWSIIATLDFVPQRAARGVDVDSNILFYSSIIWADFAAICGFILFFAMAVIKRKDRNLHIPLMIFASLSILEPALYRIWFWDIFGGIDRLQAHHLSLAALVLLSLIIAGYEYLKVQKVQAITLFCIAVMLGLRIIFIYLISDSNPGITFIRLLY